MYNYFNIYFDLHSNQEIIKYRKLRKEYILSSDDSDLLNEFQINEEENPYHIIHSKEITKLTPAYEAIFVNVVDNIYDFETRIQPIGTFLLGLLNINLDNYSDLKKFAFKYGLDILLYMDKSNILNSCIIYSLNDFDELFIKFFDSVKNTIAKLQQKFKEAIDFCFNDSGDKDINKLNPMQRYFLSFHGCDANIYFTKIPKFQKYSKGISIDFGSFFNTDIHLSEFNAKQLLSTVASKDFAFAPSFYSCPKLENALFISFVNLLETKDLHINKCANCGKLFIPTSKSNEIYCDNPLVDEPSHTCKMVGADKKYKDKIKDDEILKLIRNTSSTLSMRVKRNPDIKEHKIKNDKWKSDYPIQMKKYQNQEITKDELIKWINDVRR